MDKLLVVLLIWLMLAIFCQFAVPWKTIKASNGQFPDTVPLCVRWQVYDEFAAPKFAGSPAEIIVEMANDWNIAHSLERVLSWKRKYSLESYTFKELGKAFNGAFLIERILNTKNPPCNVCLPSTNFISCPHEMYLLQSDTLQGRFLCSTCPQ